MNLLMKALGRFDGNWNFEGVATQETALSLDSTVRNSHGYTPEKMRDAYIDILSTAAASMPHLTGLLVHELPRRQPAVHCRRRKCRRGEGCGHGWTRRHAGQPGAKKMTYPFYDQFQFKMPMFAQVETVCYAHRHMTSGYRTKYWTMQELFRYARDDMHVDYVFWVRLPKPSPWDSYAYPDALPVIANNPTF